MKSKRLWAAFGISVALNLFLAGFVLARLGFHGPLRDRGGPAPDPSALFQGGPGMWQHALGEDADFRAQRRKIRESRKQVFEAMTAEPFDARSLAEAFERLREEGQTAQVIVHDAIVKEATTMTNAERRGLADRQRRGRRRPGPRPGTH